MSALFVYGSLSPGEKHDEYLKNLKGQWAPATVQGRVLWEGTPETEGYPALILDNKGGPVRGKVFISPELERMWAILDEFEGPAYFRTQTMVRAETGDPITAFIYVLAGPEGTASPLDATDLN